VQEVAHRPWPLPADRGDARAGTTALCALAGRRRSDAALLPSQLPSIYLKGRPGSRSFRFAYGCPVAGTPAVPWLSAFPELNVRTYVTFDGKPGVWFFSLDARNSVAVAVARTWFHLPYFRARMNCAEREGWILYQSERTHRGAPVARWKPYRPVSEVLRRSLGLWSILD